MNSLSKIDPETNHIFDLEKKRQKDTINLIASENYASRAVLEATGSIFTDKYAEGYSGKRHYGGCENMDKVETLAIERVKVLFHAEHANVQAHSGAQANASAYFALIKPGDTVMGMRLAHGGHLTHGSNVSFSGRFYHFIHYGVSQDTERINYQEVEQLAKEHRPKLIMVGASSYPRVIDYDRFRQTCDMVGAKLVADIAHIAGMVAVGLHPSPVPYAEVVTSTTHKTLRGPRGGFILCQKDFASAIDTAVFPGVQGGPLMNIVAAKAVCFHEALQPGFVEYQRAILDNAQVLASEITKRGLRLVSGGTDNHLMLIDLTSTGLSGADVENALARTNIVANRNVIPFDPRPSSVASGIRLGTPAVTTRGFGKEEMKFIASSIVKIIEHIGDAAIEKEIAEEVKHICSRFPVPGIDD